MFSNDVYSQKKQINRKSADECLFAFRVKHVCARKRQQAEKIEYTSLYLLHIEHKLKEKAFRQTQKSEGGRKSMLNFYFLKQVARGY